MLHTSSDAATTRYNHVRNNKWERVSVAVGDVGCGWLVAVAETLGVVVGVEGVMVSLLLLWIVACVCGAAEVSQKISWSQKNVQWAKSTYGIPPCLYQG
jgi:hypothetical protein